MSKRQNAADAVTMVFWVAEVTQGASEAVLKAII